MLKTNYNTTSVVTTHEKDRFDQVFDKKTTFKHRNKTNEKTI